MLKHKIPLCIGIYGPRLSGKDTAADYFATTLNLTKLSLADPIKDEYSKLLHIPLHSLYNQGSNKEKHRIGLITLGMLRRQTDLDWWCKLLHTRVKYDTGVIIPDIRFQNEVEYFNNSSDTFILLKIDANRKTRKDRGWSMAIADNTATELEHLTFKSKTTYTIQNNSDLMHLNNQLQNIINDLSLASVLEFVVN